MPEPARDDCQPTLARKVVAVVLVIVFATAVGLFVTWRSAAPPPPRPVGVFP